MPETSFENAQYLNIATFRKTGARVETPVWFAADNGVFYIFSNRDAGKVKRLRNSSRCAIAPCTMIGKPTGPWQDSEAFIIADIAEIKAAHAALKKKYGWQMTMLDTGARLGRRINQRTFIRIQQPK